MALLQILRAPHPKLKVKALPVREIDEEIRTLLNDMLETMYQAEGCGLAATQVGIAQRLVVMDLSEDPEVPAPLKLVNPEILKISEGTQFFNEGCLSVPGTREEVERSAEVTYRYVDEKGDAVERRAVGIEAVCIQHEIDHLNGILFIDYLSSLKKKRILTRLQKNKSLSKQEKIF